jgi:nucleotidyltransferase substrate binding protein (TIGR01987 family)
MQRERLNEKFADFKNAYNRLVEACALEIDNDIVIDGVIQRFEFTFELGWKLMKAYLEYEGVEEAQAPRSTIKCAFAANLIEDGDEWISMMLDRNKTSHIYDAKTAREIYENIKSNHIVLLAKLLHNMVDVI